MDSLRDLWDNTKYTNIHIKGVPDREEGEWAGKLSEDIIAENFPNLVKETDIQVQEAQRAPNKTNLKRFTPRHTVIKMAKIKDKERILKVAREKQLVMDKGTPIRLSAGFSAETLQARGSGLIYLK